MASHSLWFEPWKNIVITNSVSYCFHSHSSLLAPTLFKFKLRAVINSAQLKAAQVVGLLSHTMSLSLLPHPSVMLLDTTESTSELGWTTYPDTGVSRELNSVNVLSSCRSFKAAMLGGRPDVLHTCYTWLCLKCTVIITLFVGLCGATLTRD